MAQMTQKELEQLIDERSKKQIAEAVASVKAEIGAVNNGVDEKKLDEAVAKAIQKVQEENKKSLKDNSDMLLNFEKANAEKEIKGLKKENVKSVVNQMIGSALFAMEKSKKNNVAMVGADEILASAKEKYPESKALHAVLESRAKALTASVPTDGGFTVPIAFSADYIEMLYANTILEKLGVRKVPMPNGNLSIPKMTESATAYWVGEAQKVNASQATFGEVNLKAKKLGAMSPVSNSLLRYTGVGLDSWIADDLMEKVRIALDKAFLKGTGTEHTPLGLYNTTGVQTYSGNSGALEITTPLDMFALLEQANAPFGNVKWLLNPVGKSWLAGKAFSSGPFAWAEEIGKNRQLNGYDIITSTSVDYTPDAGTPANSTADFWLGDFSQLLWGVGYDITVEMSREGTYIDPNGNTVSAFQNDLTLVRLITEHDFACRNAQAFVKGTLTKA